MVIPNKSLTTRKTVYTGISCHGCTRRHVLVISFQGRYTRNHLPDHGDRKIYLHRDFQAQSILGKLKADCNSLKTTLTRKI